MKTKGLNNLYAFTQRLSIDLSLSENPLGCSPKVLEALNKISEKDLFDYPDPADSTLINKLAQKTGLKSENLMLGNGSESLIKLLCETNIGEVVIPELSFPMFEICAKQAGSEVIVSSITKDFDIDLNDMSKRVCKHASLVFITNPNNPTGRILPKDSIVKFVKQCRAQVIIDEANIEFGGESVIDLVKNTPNLAVLRTFSKAFGLAGLRIGFLAGPENLVAKLKSRQQPFPISKIAINAALTALDDQGFIIKSKQFMDKQRIFLTEELIKRGFEVLPSNANNLLIKVEMVCGSTEFCNLLAQDDVSVINGNNFPSLGESFIRVSPRTKDVNQKFLAAIDIILKEKGRLKDDLMTSH